MGIMLGLTSFEASSEDVGVELVDHLQRSVPHLTVERVSASPATGLRQVEILEQTAIFYVTEDGKHVVAGDLYAVSAEGLVNLTENRRAERIRSLIGDRLTAEHTINFPPAGDRMSVIYVFTDIDCDYCRQLHNGVDKLNDHGVEVRYLAYPRGGPDSAAYGQMASAWCSQTPAVALSELMTGSAIDFTPCEDPIPEHMELGALVGIEGTPTIVTEEGERIDGFLPVTEILRRIGPQRTLESR